MALNAEPSLRGSFCSGGLSSSVSPGLRPVLPDLPVFQHQGSGSIEESCMHNLIFSMSGAEFGWQRVTESLAGGSEFILPEEKCGFLAKLNFI